MDFPSPVRARAHRRAWAAVLLVTLILLSLLNYYVFFTVHRQHIQSQIEALSTVVDLHADRIEQSLRTIEVSLENTILRYRAPHSPAELHELMKQTEQTLSEVRVIGLTDSTGRVIRSSRSNPPPSVSLADRDYIAYYLKGGTEPRYLSGPIRNAVDGKWQISLSLPIRGPDDRLEGVITAVIEPSIFAEAFARTSQTQDFVTLLYKDFSLIARHPWRENDIGRSLANAPVYQELTASADGKTSGEFANFFSGERRFAAARRLYHDLLSVSSSRPADEALASWRFLATVSTVISLLLLFVEIVAFIITDRSLRRMAAADAALVEMNRKLSDQTKRAEHLAEAKSVFLANMSHEIRTPLGGILGYADMLLETGLQEPQAGWARKLRAAGNQLLAVINDVLDYSKLEAGQFAIDQKPAMLAVIADNAISMIALRTRERGLALRVDVDPQLPPSIVTDPVRLSQILLNLLSNAAKFTDRGSIVLTLSRGSLPDGRPALRIDVADTGIGIPEDKIDKVFDRFTQIEGNIAGARGGTGLGLPISRRLAELMGGSLTLRSRAGVGTTVTLTLPLEVGAVETTPDKESSMPAMRAGRILLIEDLPMNQEIAGALLRGIGHSVDIAASGAEAIERFAARPYDAVLVDINLPDMNGYDVTRELRKLEPHGQHTPILALTANTLPEDRARARIAGMDDHLAKPFDRAAIARKLANFLGPQAGRTETACSTTAGASSPAPLIDTGAVTTLSRVIGSDTVKAMQDEFWADWPVNADRVSALVTDLPGLADHAHDLVSLAGNIGYLRLAHACRDLMRAASDRHDPEMIGSLIRQIFSVAEDSRRQETSQRAA